MRGKREKGQVVMERGGDVRELKENKQFDVLIDNNRFKCFKLFADPGCWHLHLSAR